MGIAITILALLVVGAIVGSALNFMSLFLGIPLALIFIGAVIGKETMERQQKILQMKRFRRESRTQKVTFDTADKRTLV
ncbi:MAG: hypothetical protein QOD53_2213 [Thermoleophilaceae bacterium]|jgi:uncharacterized membrane protein|nr:hypothetical protein [Thermoleophilaceae bacterium]